MLKLYYSRNMNELEKKLGYDFNDKSLLVNSMIISSDK
jgi:dsRNA-specific ribonuclease